MKFIKSNSVNFSKFCNFDETEEEKSQISDDHNPGELIDNIVSKSKENEQTEQVPEQQGTTPQDEFLEQQQVETERKAVQAELEKNARNQAHEDRVANLGSAGEELGATPSDLNNDDLNEMAAEPYDELPKFRGKVGDLTEEGTTKAVGAVKTAANTVGDVLNKFDKTKGLGKSLKDRVTKVNEKDVGEKVGDWADEHKVAAGAIGAGALLGAGLLAKKGYDLAKGKKELQADAFYAFEGDEIDKGSLIGGPYATRKDAREAHPEASHILRGSTLAAYGDFEVA